MARSVITAKNYAAQAELAIRRGWPTPYFLEMADGIAKAEHFALPDYGRIFDDKLRGLPPPPWRLPYPLMTIEWWNPGCSQASVLLAEESEGFTIVRIMARGSVLGAHWCPGQYGAKLTTEGHLEILNLPGAQGLDASFGINELKEQVTVMMRPLFELVEALTCKNVCAEVMERVDVTKNAKRIRRGKLPLYETKHLVIEVPQSAQERKDHGGTHAPPRQHLRRGHIRRLPSGNYWVNACVVGSPERGVIDKSYAVTT